jgi:hypothetical protein
MLNDRSDETRTIEARLERAIDIFGWQTISHLAGSRQTYVAPTLQAFAIIARVAGSAFPPCF